MNETCALCDERAYIHGVGISLCKAHDVELNAWNRAIEDALTASEGGPTPQRCPRRDEMFQQGGPPDETPDAWRYRTNYLGDHERVCSYCGSVHPDFFMEKIRDGWTWGATDKNYKAYLGPDGSQAHKFYFQHLSDDQRREVVEMVNAGRVKFGESGLYRLPYFMQRAGS